jgi:hypothetical protein
MKSAALIYRERDLLRNGGLARNSYLVTINSNANEKWQAFNRIIVDVIPK